MARWRVVLEAASGTVRMDVGKRDTSMPAAGGLAGSQIAQADRCTQRMSRWRCTRALEAAGLPRQRFHDLRHAYATLMLEAGEDLASLSRSLGHANLSTTADVYAHHTAGMAARSADRIGGILARQAVG